MTLSATQVGSKKGFKKVATYKLASSDANFAVVADQLGRAVAGPGQVPGSGPGRGGALAHRQGDRQRQAQRRA